MVMVGILAAATNVLTVEQLAEALPHVLAERHHKLIPLNRQAMEAGYQAARVGLPAGGN
jgi:2-oxoglutarate ferredoxin oxidoreductase subunit gamma